jgi:hypothetical protein
VKDGWSCEVVYHVVGYRDDELMDGTRREAMSKTAKDRTCSIVNDMIEALEFPYYQICSIMIRA